MSNVPETIDYNEQILDSKGKFKLVKEAWFKAACTKIAKRVTKVKERLELTLNMEPLDETDKPCGTAVPLRIYPPISNPNATDKSIPPPNTLRQCYFLARSIDPKFPRYARKGTEKGTFITADGRTVDRQTRDQINREVDKAILKTAVGWWNDPTTLQDELMFVHVRHEKGNDGRTYHSVDRTRLDAPEGETILTSDFTA